MCSVSCFFIRRGWRGRGVGTQLLRAAIPYVAGKGGRTLEGYPVDRGAARSADAFVYTGLASAFRAAGFTEVARRSPTRPIMRFEIAE